MDIKDLILIRTRLQQNLFSVNGFTLIRTSLERNLANVKGFTLIELLVVISIVVLLSAFSAFGLRGSFENARNTQRQSDLKQYQTAVEAYANSKNGVYVSRINGNGVRASTVLCTDIGLTSGSCPEDPLYLKNPSSWMYYMFESNGVEGTLSATSYVMWARIEGATTSYSVICSTGKSGKVTTDPGGNNGACPL